MFGQLHPPSEIPFHYPSPSLNGNSSRFQQIPHHQNHVTTKEKYTLRITILSTIYYKHHSLKQSLTIKEISTSKQQIFYQFFSI